MIRRPVVDLEWDEAKRRNNLAKHGVDFVDAAGVFADARAIVAVNARRDYGEIRLRAIGRVRETVLAVVFTDRTDRRRIISARRASRRERETYEAFGA